MFLGARKLPTSLKPQDGAYCYPLLIADQPPRLLLASHGLVFTKTVAARPVFDTPDCERTV